VSSPAVSRAQGFVPYDELPTLPASGLPHSWDVFGRDDQLGTLNRIDDEAVVQAVGLVTSGERICLSLPLDVPNPPLFSRRPLQHSVYEVRRNTWDDRIDNFYPQGSSQWDSLRHIRAREDGFYGGWTGNPDSDPERLGIQHWAAAGIVGRGVLVDIPGLLADMGFDPFDAVTIEVDHIEQALERQGTSLGYGDILCLNTGWMGKYLALDDAGRAELARALAEPPNRCWAGLSPGAPMSRYLWDAGLAAIVADNPSVEFAPGDPKLGSLHRRLLPCLGFALGELFDLTTLTLRSRETGRYDFLFVGVPLSLRGGVGSPANAIAVR
jgi:kynurenine formamidase